MFRADSIDSPQLSPEEKLAIAVIDRAFYDLSGTRAEAMDAAEWFLDERVLPYSFCSLLDHLTFGDMIRGKLIEEAQAAKLRLGVKVEKANPTARAKVMSINSKKKGSRGELEACKVISKLYGVNARRTQQFCGNTGDASDIVVDGCESYHFEVKRRERLYLTDLYSQIERDTKVTGKTPIVIHRRNNSSWACLIGARFIREDSPLSEFVKHALLGETPIVSSVQKLHDAFIADKKADTFLIRKKDIGEDLFIGTRLPIIFDIILGRNGDKGS